jgi:hypothetical protein
VVAAVLQPQVQALGSVGFVMVILLAHNRAHPL